MKKIAILINTAAFSKYYIKLGKKLIEKGNEVVFLVNNEFSKELYFHSENTEHVITFNSKLSVDADFKLPEDITSWILHPDYDRGCYYGFKNEFKQKNGYNEIKKMYYFLYLNLKKFKPDYVFYENISNCYAHLAYIAASNLNIKYLGLTASRLPSKFYFSQIGNEIKDNITTQIEKNQFTKDEINIAKKYIDNLVSIQPDYMVFNGLSNTSLLSILKKKKPSLHSIKTHIKYLSSVGLQMGIPIKSSLIYRLRDIYRLINKRRIKKLYQKADIIFSPQNKFYLFPLHYHPESSTSLLAKNYDEYEVIKNIAFSMKENEILIVKDHISASGFEKFNYYEKIANLPNVVLIKPDINVKSIVRQCNAVITLTSTVGYEAVLLNIPVMLFGTVFYEDHPLVTKINSYSEIRNILDSLPSNKKDYSEYNIKFVAAYYKECFDFSLDLRNKDTAEGIDLLTDIILEQ